MYLVLLRSSRRAAGFALLLWLALLSAVSAQQPDLKVNLSAKRVLVDQGKETVTAADKVKPGDVIQYEAIYKNAGTGAATNVGAIVPIPKGLALLPDSATPPASEGSLDGKNFSAIPLTREIKNEAGLLETKQVPLAEYRALRWKLSEIPAGGSTSVALRARVGTNASQP